MRQAPVSLPLGIVIRRTPSASRWVPFAWQAVAVLPGAAQADWQVLREEGDAVEFHAATVSLELWHTDTEAYLTTLSSRVPSIGVVMRENEDPDADHPYDILLATASAYEFQDYADSGEELLELVPMPEGLIAFLRDFVQAHHEEEVFVKRRRDKKRTDLTEDGRGDARISQLSDVYRAPRTGRPN
ncbi:DUF3305 domain-containing protein [Shimia sp. R9_1]|uniref:DUF3305 domain-containing protein n=1 Tax=unclassified Shimia TaxID=2630038 RepID=UPI001ADB7B53|nr:MULTISPECIES: DUF3305 domain-containing protein [unclassified Shimia]MBO9395487.1 DUF3305 domain-containing protein [Shimia sp. R9_2]MBO9407491.1 DUF3305 domain-containing protein [Shimia sp. R9_1]